MKDRVFSDANIDQALRMLEHTGEANFDRAQPELRLRRHGGLLTLAWNEDNGRLYLIFNDGSEYVQDLADTSHYSRAKEILASQAPRGDAALGDWIFKHMGFRPTENYCQRGTSGCNCGLD